jgi:hypothetical protein
MMHVEQLYGLKSFLLQTENGSKITVRAFVDAIQYKKFRDQVNSEVRKNKLESDYLGMLKMARELAKRVQNYEEVYLDK